MRLINRISAIYVICWTFVPSVQVGDIYRIFAINFALLWILTALSTNTSFLRKNQMYIILSVISVVLVIFLKMQIGSVSSAITTTIQSIIMLIIGLMAIFYFEIDRDFLETVLTVVLILIAVYSFTTIKGLIENPYASRIANSEWLAERFEGNENIGLYGYIYMCVFFEIFLCLLKKYKIKVNKIFDIMAIVDIVLIICMVAMAGYTIAIFCVTCGVASVHLFDSNKPIRNIYVIFVLLGVVANYKMIAEFVLNILPGIVGDNPVYTSKIDEFRMLLLYNNSTVGDVGERFSNYSKSVEMILRYPFIGANIFGKQLGGGHSFILDYIGRYGFAVAGGYFYLFFTMPHRIGTYKHKWNQGDWIFFIIAFVFLLSDPISQELAIAFFWMFPFVQYRIRLRDEQGVENEFSKRNNYLYR